MQLLSPAKINLFLHVTAKRADGYHELFSLMSCISLYDRILLDFSGSGIRLTCSDPAVPANGDNLAAKAALFFYRALGSPPSPGVRIHLEKSIPVGAGLGGGSSNAAAVLLGLNERHGNPFSPARLCAIGLTIGADVPFFMFGRPALASGIGDQLEAVGSLRPYAVTLVFPGFSVSTASVYRQLNLRLTKFEKKPTKALLNRSGFDAARHLHNDLETVSLKAYPEIGEVKRALADQGARGVLMSGSGPSVFGLFDCRQAALEAKTAVSHRPRWRVFVVDMITADPEIAGGLRRTP